MIWKKMLYTHITEDIVENLRLTAYVLEKLIIQQNLQPSVVAKLSGIAVNTCIKYDAAVTFT